MSRANDRQIILRVPAQVWKRAVRLARALQDRPEYAGMRVTTSAALRIALLAGLEVLERREGRSR